jgi:carboxyl-terminal processing protease
VDLRGNSGGLFDAAVESSGLLLPKGATLASAVGRGGQKKPHVTSRSPVLARLPTVVLIDGGTFSSGEILAGALRDGLGAKLVGKRTGGKWNAQKVVPLSNGYALKYTVMQFETPGGERPDGVGLSPHLEVELDAAEVARLRRLPPAERLKADGQLRTALSSLGR